jgi:hypothetical protein
MVLAGMRAHICAAGNEFHIQIVCQVADCLRLPVRSWAELMVKMGGSDLQARQEARQVKQAQAVCPPGDAYDHTRISRQRIEMQAVIHPAY